MAADALEITSSSVRRLSNALAVGFKGEADADGAGTVVSVHPLMSMSLMRHPAANNEHVAGRVALDCATGICPVTEAQQRLIMLEPVQGKQLHDNLLDLSTE